MYSETIFYLEVEQNNCHILKNDNNNECTCIQHLLFDYPLFIQLRKIPYRDMDMVRVTLCLSVKE